MKFKFLFTMSVLFLCTSFVQACSTNPATGKKQFTALMSPQQEVQIGAEEHEKVKAQFGIYENAALTQYVRDVGNKVTRKTERPDVSYKFYVIDSPIVNAFALPGGYIYVSRGLLALANNEAQLAAVLSHEAGHITGRHSAERYSRGVVTTLGAGVLGAVIGSNTAAQALSTGSNLYLSSYSRGQENEADSLGLRYMTQGGYEPDEMSKFLSALQAQTGLDARLEGKSGNNFSYFSTHPATSDRVQKTLAESKAYNAQGNVNRDTYLQKINGMTYGDSASQGFVRDNSFYHPKLGFAFDVPKGFKISNQPSAVVATSDNGGVILFDMAKRTQGQGASAYLTQTWMKDKALKAEKITINGMNAAAASFEGKVNGSPMTIQLVAIEWEQGSFARFQVAIPKGASSSFVDGLKKATYSFHAMTAAEKQKYKPYRIALVSAKSGDTIASLARRMPYTQLQQERFQVLNSLIPGEALVTGRLYKTIEE